MTRMGGRTRARQSDRDAVVDALSAAYADGQISADDHAVRVSSALAAVRVSDLVAVLGDLQVPPDHPAGRLMAPPVPGRRSREPRRRPGRRIAMLVAAAGVVVVGVPLGILAMADDDEPRVPEPMMTVDAIETMVADIDAEFGVTEVVSVEMHQNFSYVMLPTDDGLPRHETWTYDPPGEFSDWPGGNLPEADPDLVDLVDLDAARLVSNIETAASTLGVAGDLQVTVKVTDAYPTLLNATVDAGDPVPPHVEIFLSNRFMESATLTTDLSGREVLLRDAFDRAGGG